ncbi:TetR/AcrR family transcriptional regulator [Arenivirga flava]|uniref:TetR family transcriptional regulator n=1 Tax=Arenivirga flava TaxID=1930060 RepID=A0AA37UC71_9MICO|nr:TetR/AcrR family transcriptional regulator [Arenivirga flava]GMA27490.1 TetR family transcriptional regulator [Arenivirga flava]
MTPSDRQRRTRRALVDGARALTAEHGLAGFTVEQLCELAGVSRRTFFNYFPTKESAVLGVDPDWDEAFLERFRSIPAHDRLGPLDDLASLTVDAFAEMGTTRDEARTMVAAVRREPRILAAFIEQDRTQEQRLTDAIVDRDGVDPLAARMTAVLLGAIVRTTAQQVFEGDGDLAEFADVLRAHLDAARSAMHDSPATPITRTKDA